METLVVINSGRTRRVTEKGREYLVAPLTLIVPGVLNGSKGPLLYTAEDTSSRASTWNKIPIVVYHPTDPLTGRPLSAKAKGVWERQGIGELRNTSFKDKLRAEGWFEVERTRRVDNRIYKALVEGTTLELSTGLFTTNEPAPPGSTFNGRSYTFFARNHVPDHLAILPDQVGACSINDGCGVLVNQLTENKEGPFKFSSTQFNLSPADTKAVKAIQRRIAKSDLDGDGYETEPHVTVKYGLHVQTPSQVEKLVSDQGSITVKLGPISVFRNAGKPDVVKIGVTSSALRKLNRLLSTELKTTDTFDTYRPHLTLAYVKEGTGRKYAGSHPLEGKELTFTKLQFSNKDGEKTELSLNSFDPSQKRDEDGKWSTIKGGGKKQEPPKTREVPALSAKPERGEAILIRFKNPRKVKSFATSLGEKILPVLDKASELLASKEFNWASFGATLGSGFHPIPTTAFTASILAQLYKDARYKYDPKTQTGPLNNESVEKLAKKLLKLLAEAYKEETTENWTPLSNKNCGIGPDGFQPGNDCAGEDGEEELSAEGAGVGGVLGSALGGAAVGALTGGPLGATAGLIAGGAIGTFGGANIKKLFKHRKPNPRSSTASGVAKLHAAAAGSVEAQGRLLLPIRPTDNADCGTGAGGFKKGNTCGKGEGDWTAIGGKDYGPRDVRKQYQHSPPGHGGAAGRGNVYGQEKGGFGSHEDRQTLRGDRFRGEEFEASHGALKPTQDAVDATRQWLDNWEGSILNPERASIRYWGEVAESEAATGSTASDWAGFHSELKSVSKRKQDASTAHIMAKNRHNDIAESLKENFLGIRGGSQDSQVRRLIKLHQDAAALHHDAAEMIVGNYDDSQPRDNHGRWSDKTLGQQVYGVAEKAGVLAGVAGLGVAGIMAAGASVQAAAAGATSVAGSSLGLGTVAAGTGALEIGAGLFAAGSLGLLAAPLVVGVISQGRAGGLLDSQTFDELKDVMSGIFSRLTLGTGPLAVKAISLGVRHSPKLFGLVADGLREAHEGWKSVRNQLISNNVTEEQLRAQLPPSLAELALHLRDHPEDVPEFIEACKAALSVVGDWTPIGNAGTWDESKHPRDKGKFTSKAGPAGAKSGHRERENQLDPITRDVSPRSFNEEVEASQGAHTVTVQADDTRYRLFRDFQPISDFKNDGMEYRLANEFSQAAAEFGRKFNVYRDADNNLYLYKDAYINHAAASDLYDRAIKLLQNLKPKNKMAREKLAEVIQLHIEAKALHHDAAEFAKSYRHPTGNAGQYEEGKHKRDNAGKFSTTGGGGDTSGQSTTGTPKGLSSAPSTPTPTPLAPTAPRQRVSDAEGGATQTFIKEALSSNPLTQAIGGVVSSTVPGFQSRADKAANEEVKQVLQGIFSRMTLGTGPLAVRAVAAGARKSPQLFRLLMRGLAEAKRGAVAGAKAVGGAVVAAKDAIKASHAEEDANKGMSPLEASMKGQYKAPENKGGGSKDGVFQSIGGSIKEGIRQATSYLPPKMGRDKAAERAERKSKEAAIAGDTEGAARWKALAEEHKYRSKSWAPLPTKNVRLVNREYTRDEDGKFSSSGGSSAGSEAKPTEKPLRKRKKGEARTPDMAPEPNADSHHKFKGMLSGGMVGMLAGAAAAGPVGAVAGGALGMIGGRWAATPGSKQQLKRVLGLNAEGEEIPWEQLPAGAEGENTWEGIDLGPADADTQKKDRSTVDPFEDDKPLQKLPPSLALLARILKKHPEMLPRLVEASKEALAVLDDAEGRVEGEEDENAQPEDMTEGENSGYTEGEEEELEEENSLEGEELPEEPTSPDKPTPEAEEEDMRRSVENLLLEDNYPLLTNEELGISAVYNTDKERLLSYAAMHQFAWERGEVIANSNPHGRKVQLSLIDIGETLVANARAGAMADMDDGGEGKGHFFSSCERDEKGWCVGAEVSRHIDRAIKSRVSDRIAGRIDDHVSAKFDRMINEHIEAELRKRFPEEKRPEKKVSLIRRAVKKLLVAGATGTAGAMAGAKLGGIAGGLVGNPVAGVLGGATAGGLAGLTAGSIGAKNVGKLAGYIAKKIARTTGIAGKGFGKLLTSPGALGAAGGAALIGSGVATAGGSLLGAGIGAGVGALAGGVAGRKFGKFAKAGLSKSGDVNEQARIKKLQEKHDAERLAKAPERRAALEKEEAERLDQEKTHKFGRFAPTSTKTWFPKKQSIELPSAPVAEMPAFLPEGGKTTKSPKEPDRDAAFFSKDQEAASAVSEAVELSQRDKVRSRTGKEKAAEAHKRAAELLDRAGKVLLAEEHRTMAEELEAAAQRVRARKRKDGPATNSEDGLDFLDEPGAIDEMAEAASEIEARIDAYHRKNFEVDWNPKWTPIQTASSGTRVSKESLNDDELVGRDRMGNQTATSFPVNRLKRRSPAFGRKKPTINSLVTNCGEDKTCGPCSSKKKRKKLENPGTKRNWTTIS